MESTPRSRVLPHNVNAIPTRSSRPHTHPHALPREIVRRILTLRTERNQCAEILHHRLSREGYLVSLSSVKRTLKRFCCSRYSRWKKCHRYPEKPLPEKLGMLVEIDTIHDGPHEDRLYIYAMLDVCSRWAYAEATVKINLWCIFTVRLETISCKIANAILRIPEIRSSAAEEG